MCHGHPTQFGCGHMILNWHYCPSAHIDLGTGYESPCLSTTFAGTQMSSASCSLQACDFSNTGGKWICCQCKGTSTKGWCENARPTPKWVKDPSTAEWQYLTMCDHGCCTNCERDEMAVRQAKKAKGKHRSRHASAAHAIAEASISHSAGSTSGRTSSKHKTSRKDSSHPKDGGHSCGH